jgi:hypothetical protein
MDPSVTTLLASAMPPNMAQRTTAGKRSHDEYALSATRSLIGWST